jgi:hypothetical protein
MKALQPTLRTGRVLLLLLLSLSTSEILGTPKQLADRQQAISLHPENPKYFLFRGKPLALITATEHYGSVVNAAFDFERYLQDAADKRMTLTRLFLLFREQQSARNPYSPIKPDTPDFLTPFLRTGPGKALDGERKFDLDKWNPAYFERLHRFLKRASELGIVVEVTLFSNSYGDSVWALHPFHSKNNVNGLKPIEWPEYTTLKSNDLFSRQVSYVRKIIQETSRYDNLYYEICNEPGGGVANHSSPEDVDAWQAAIAKEVRQEMLRLNSPHLIFGSQAFTYTPKFFQNTDDSFRMQFLDAINIHPLPDTAFRGRVFQMGNFMSKELKLSEIRDFCLGTAGQTKPVVMDQDNAASLYRNDVGWTIHRKRAWTALISGAHYDFIDFSVTVGNDAGTEESRRKIRTWMRNLSVFMHSFKFIRAKPLQGWIQARPDFVVESVLGIPGKEYVIYLADAREVDDPEAGKPIQMNLRMPLPAGRYRAVLYSPLAGVYSPAVRLESTGEAELELAAFEQDLVVRVQQVP